MEVDINQYERLELEDALIQVHTYGTQTIAVIDGIAPPVEPEVSKEPELEPTKKPILWVGASVQTASLAGQNGDAYSNPFYELDADFLEHYYDGVSVGHQYRLRPYGSPTVNAGSTNTRGTDHQTQYIPYVNIIVCEPGWDSETENTKTVIQSAAGTYYWSSALRAKLNKTGAALVYDVQEVDQNFTYSGTAGKRTITGNYGDRYTYSTSGMGGDMGAYSLDCAGNYFNYSWIRSTESISTSIDDSAWDWQNNILYSGEPSHIIPPRTYTTTSAYINVVSAATPSGMYTLAPIPHIVSNTVSVETAVSLIPDDTVKTIADLRDTLYVSTDKYLTNNTYSWPYGFVEVASNSETSVSYGPQATLSTSSFVPHVLDPVDGCTSNFPNIYIYNIGISISGGDTATGHVYSTSAFANRFVNINEFDIPFSHQSPGTIYDGEYKIYILLSDQSFVFNNNVTCTVDVYIQLDAKKEPKKFTIDVDSIATRNQGYYDTSAAGALPGTGDGWYAGHWVVDVKKQTITHVTPPP